MTCYLLHLDKPLSRGVSPTGTPLVAGHYIGYTTDLISRIDAHVATTWQPLPEPVVENGKRRRGAKKGPGATFMGFVNFMGIEWRLARIWEGADQTVEKKLKNCKKASWLCPCCTPNALNHMTLDFIVGQTGRNGI
jgi:hypothetical protein